MNRPAAIAAASVTRVSSSARLRSGCSLMRPDDGPWTEDDGHIACRQSSVVNRHSMEEQRYDKIRHWPCHDPRVNAVQQAAVSAEQVARVFDPDLSLEHRDSQVAERAKQRYHEADHCARKPPHRRVWPGPETGQPTEQCPQYHRREDASDETFPRLLGAEAGDHRMPAEPLAEYVSAGVRKPNGRK